MKELLLLVLSIAMRTAIATECPSSFSPVTSFDPTQINDGYCLYIEATNAKTGNETFICNSTKTASYDKASNTVTLNMQLPKQPVVVELDDKNPGKGWIKGTNNSVVWGYFDSSWMIVAMCGKAIFAGAYLKCSIPQANANVFEFQKIQTKIKFTDYTVYCKPENAWYWGLIKGIHG